MNIKEQLEQWINDSAYRRAIRQSSTGLKSLDEALQWHIRIGYEDGANEIKELLLIAVEALDKYVELGGNWTRAASALAEIQEKIKGE